ncbi:alpha/beta hydrolase [Mycolicibacterium vinylchloridicum]|uniref:alpha/beta hydrolase n=1 Tax=Mycolicibacterium vinylchloridicum TaxID=2736928 RepID=UPI001F2193C3|nr:alpha/beta hydrolase [Mycolicibacterium vinylchloridicum]
MTLTVLDIERWNAGDVREVFHAAISRAQAAKDAADGLATLPAFATWGGEAAEAAKDAIGQTRKDLDAHGNEAQAVANAARHAADEIERIKAELATLKADAQSLGMEIDPVAGTVVPGPSVRNPMEAELKEMQLQPRLDKIVADANLVDVALANAINMAGGKTPIPSTGPHPQIPDRPPPDDPTQFADYWRSLSKEQKDYLYSQDHNIGNHPGMPAGDDQHPAADYYNKLNLADQLATSQAAASEADALRAQHPDWAAGQNIPAPNKPGAIFDNRLKYEAWQRQLNDALGRAKYLPDLRAVDKAINDGPDRKLMLLDTTSGDQARAAIAIGNPDTADHVSVTTPGLNTTVHGAIDGMTNEARQLRQEALRQLQNVPGHEGDTVSTIAWIGYDAPQVPGFDDLKGSAEGGWEVSHDTVARAGAADLSKFYDGITAAHEGGPVHLTAVGHSYGSLTTGLALQEPGSHGVSDAIFYGSPGIEATTPSELGLQPGHVFTMETPDDPIQKVYDLPPWAHVAVETLPPPLRGFGESIMRTLDASGAGQFGPNPATNPNFVHLETGATTVPDGSGTMNLGAAHGHSDYPRFGDDGTPRTTNYNIAAVIAGLSGDAVRQK